MKFFLVFFITIFIVWGRIQAGIAQTVWTWNQCVHQVAARNLDLLAAQQAVQSAQALHLASLGQFFPHFSISASANEPAEFGGLANAFQGPYPNQNVQYGLNITQDIFSGFKDISNVNLTSAQLELAKAQFIQTQAQVSYDLKTSFYQLLYAQQLISLLKTIIARQKVNMNLVDLDFKGGTDNKGSYLEAEASYRESVFELHEAIRALKVDQGQLNQVLGRNPLKSIQVQGQFTIPKVPLSPNYQELALKTPAYKEAFAQFHEAQSQKMNAQGNFLPTISATASLFRQGYEFLQTQPAWSAGLQVSLPIFTGGENWFSLKSTEAAQTGAFENLKNVRLNAISTLESDYVAYANAIEQIRLLKFELKAAQVQEVISKAEYLNGLINYIEWSQVDNELTNQQKAELSGLITEKIDAANWQLAQGIGAIP